MLRGCLWKPGVNGLGVRGWNRLLPCRRRFDAAARLHDEAYDRRGGWRERRAADAGFLHDCLRRCETDRHVLCAVAYWCAVRLCGWLFYRYGGKGEKTERQKGKGQGL